jgi:predicted nucleotidyltransferase
VPKSIARVSNAGSHTRWLSQNRLKMSEYGKGRILLLEEKGLYVDKIIILGSYAQGTENVDSDIDLIIISRNFRDKSIFERVELVSGVGRKLVKNFFSPLILTFFFPFLIIQI